MKKSGRVGKIRTKKFRLGTQGRKMKKRIWEPDFWKKRSNTIKHKEKKRIGAPKGENKEKNGGGESPRFVRKELDPKKKSKGEVFRVGITESRG